MLYTWSVDQRRSGCQASFTRLVSDDGELAGDTRGCLTVCKRGGGTLVASRHNSDSGSVYIFPQYEGLGFSSTSRRYSIKSVAEAAAYLRHPVLGPRLVECAEAALGVEGRSALAIFGSPDDRKLRSCATLFACVSPSGSLFDRLLDQYFEGERDDRTLRLLGTEPETT